MKTHPFSPVALAAPSALLLVILSPPIPARAADPVPPARIIKSEVQDNNIREITSPDSHATNAPLIGFIDSPTSACYQPDVTQNVCYINWYYMSVSASPNYMISMNVAINVFGRVANYQGFFQTSMYVPYSMHDRGFKVACGDLGAGGDPDLGNAYAWTIRAKDSADLSAANYGTVYCPAYIH